MTEIGLNEEWFRQVRNLVVCVTGYRIKDEGIALVIYEYSKLVKKLSEQQDTTEEVK